MNSLEVRKQKLSILLEALDFLVNKLLENRAKKKDCDDDSRLEYTKNLNTELQKENSLLKERLFAAISSMGSLKSKNKNIYESIDEVVKGLEELADYEDSGSKH